MSHLPYETWILEERIPAGMQAALQEHLAGCPQCQQIKQGWHGVRNEIRQIGMARPAPGFTARWQAGLAARQARQLQIQVVKTALIFLVGLFVLGIAVLGIGLVGFSPIQMIAGFGRTLAILANWFSLASQAAGVWFNVVPLPINLAIWITLSAAALLVLLGWGVTLWRYFNVGVTQS